MATATKQKSAKSGKIKLQPLGDRVVIEREEAEETTAGGIVLPDSAQNKPSRGVVVAVGDGRLLDDGTRSAMQLSAGDRVIFPAYVGSDEFKVDGRELLLIREEEILAVIE